MERADTLLLGDKACGRGRGMEGGRVEWEEEERGKREEWGSEGGAPLLGDKEGGGGSRVLRRLVNAAAPALWIT